RPPVPEQGGPQGRRGAAPSSPPPRDVPRPGPRLQLGRGPRRGRAPGARDLGAHGAAHLRAAGPPRARPAWPRHSDHHRQGAAGQPPSAQRVRGGGEGRRAGRLGRRSGQAARARPARSSPGREDRRPGRERVRRPDRGKAQRAAGKHPSWPRARDLRHQGGLVAQVVRAVVVAKPMVIGAENALPGELRVLKAAERSLNGERRGVRAVLPFLGPAFIAAVAYVDPGNFATNMAGGSQFGYMLLWVVLAGNLIAMLIQAPRAKLGIPSGRSLPEVCRDRFSFRVVVLLWLQAEAVAMATDLAEFVGAALGLHLVFGLSMWVSGVLTGVAAFTILGLQVWGFRRLEAAITGFVAVIMFAFLLNLLRSHPSTAGVVHGMFTPQFAGSQSVLLAVSIIGATVMPHVIYLHSSLTQKRIVGANPGAKRKIFRYEIIDITITMGLAGVINPAMLATAAAVLHARGLFGVGDDLEQVFGGLNQYVGGHSGLIFGVALLASGIASSCVGTMSGQVVMQG